MTVPPPPAPSRRFLSPGARAMRLQRIFARMQEGASYQEIASEEGISRERLRQIIRRATSRRSRDDRPGHRQMQIARMTPALRLAEAGVAQGDAKSIALLLKLVDRFDRYSDTRKYFRSPPFEEIAGLPGAKSSPRERQIAELIGAAPARARRPVIANEACDGIDAGPAPRIFASERRSP